VIDSKYPGDNLLSLGETMTKLTAIYLRTSTLKQEKGLESQQRALIEYCERKDIRNYQIFEDEGVSGTKAKRPALDELMRLVDEGRIEAVIVYSFSRMARSTKHLLEVLEFFRQKDVKFISTTEQIQTDNAYGRMMYTLVASFAELERSLIQERVINGLHNARAKGKKLGRPKVRPSDLIIELAKQGYTQARIAELTKTSRASVWRELKRTPTTQSEDFNWT
jgi:putative DNA-invertase from lambdoid prophage Rac